MFFFGFFTTLMPYIIISALYAIGLGLYSGNNLLEAYAKKNAAAEKEITIETKANIQIENIAGNYYYKIKTVQKTVLILQNLSLLNNATDKEYIITHLSDGYSYTPHFSFFSRPPPTC